MVKRSSNPSNKSQKRTKEESIELHCLRCNELRGYERHEQNFILYSCSRIRKVNPKILLFDCGFTSAERPCRKNAINKKDSKEVVRTRGGGKTIEGKQCGNKKKKERKI